ncbi:hypothetical protein CCHR01_08447 [Colletotrichum chrysophilum]|uniref:Uncharacterized protein n=1 Tax=Colletotrichum chrysophilum TaxID=1836956 RepID=A0AAD9ELE1_9PEZI|nr:hypothetical protein CCHR01_08447 [Colletotrichum chrysophilum]
MDVEVRTVTSRSRLAQKTWVEFLPVVDPSAVAEAQTRHRDGRSPALRGWRRFWQCVRGRGQRNGSPSLICSVVPGAFSAATLFAEGR